ncbi:MAG: 2,3-bisphosphoglycerate-independent phosphoglycerate mutase [Gammaproteobacteria bacterium]|jgi:2,3-bisphosphoglycerate-independent phosphoglycerate mutase|nr:2,3-bisphosphoglycerate-independent phosphoglycerate mutase [Gammaproteobacteria bacterium]
MKPRPVLLTIFDGFGLNPSRAHNAWALARTPHLDHYFSIYPHSVLQASGRAVGLPDGQFGNSEVGHLTLGSGRVLEQDLIRIANAIYGGTFEELPPWQTMTQNAGRLHLVGLVSDGGVHSHIEHLLGILSLLRNTEIEPVLHMITDGRDTAPQAALSYLSDIEEALEKLGRGSIATVCGRYSAMDRARHWDRTEVAWKAIVLGEGFTADSAREAIESAYARGEGDEFIQPTVISGFSGVVRDEPMLLCNFRSDRMRQLSAALGLDNFDQFDRQGHRTENLVCMTEYDATYPFPVLFPPTMPEKVLAEVISDAGLAQLHCSETEKFAHVTYFFNGGREPPYPLEDRIIVPSPKVATYDIQPQMSASKIADELIKAIESDQYSFIVTNFANADMVGHTAQCEAIIRSIEALDIQSHRVFRAALEKGWRVLLTADHGNCDEMINPNTGEPHTQHTEYPVPFLIMGEGPVRLSTGRGLADIAPTVLELLGIPQPRVMTGRSLILKKGLL